MMEHSDKTASKYKYPQILLIDDDEIDNFINERIIKSTNFAQKIIVRESAIAALNYLRECVVKKENLPNLIFLDLNMPEMDGFHFLEEFDKLAQEDQTIKTACKIIVLSSSTNTGDIDRASKNEYVYKYLNKPMREEYLAAINF